MGKLLFVLALAMWPFLAQRGLAQVKSVNETTKVSVEQTDTTVYQVVDKMPEYPGGHPQLIRAWQRRLVPLRNVEDGIPPRVIISCVINEEGQVIDAVVIRSVDSEYYDKEALQFVNTMPRWTPGEHKGKKVKVRVTLPFNTRLQ